MQGCMQSVRALCVRHDKINAIIILYFIVLLYIIILILFYLLFYYFMHVSTVWLLGAVCTVLLSGAGVVLMHGCM
jgi:hypothetical protein